MGQMRNCAWDSLHPSSLCNIMSIYGLEPNYGCCTANFNQGWPTFAHSLFFASVDGGVTVATHYALASAHLPSEVWRSSVLRLFVRHCI
jgi:hypothetical protein